MTRLALEHQAVNLAQGFPDFPPPPEIIAAAHAALDRGENQYTVTWGIPPLRAAIEAKMRRRYGLEYAADRHVTVTCGVTEAIVAAVMATVDTGDEVIIVEPFHENYLPAVLFAGGTPVFAALEPPDYRLDPERLRRVFTPRTRAILLNSPHNPSGRVFDREELAGVAALCREFDAIAITDEIYEHILYDGRAHIPIATLEGMHERTITIGGFGKTFAVTGWRLGYACAPEPLAEAFRTMHDFTTICAPAPLQHAAAAALELPESYYERTIREYTERRALMLPLLNAHGLRATPPEGAYYVMTDFSPRRFAGDDRDFARYLTKEIGVAAVPGSSFYATPGLGKNTVRFAFAKRKETLAEVERRFTRLPAL
jgi:aminotransferase